LCCQASWESQKSSDDYLPVQTFFDALVDPSLQMNLPFEQ